TVPAGLTLNANGTITVNANTPSGSYTVVYEICEVGASPINCKQATATVVVTNELVANNDTPAAVSVGDSTPSVVVNDTLDGNPVVIGTNPGQVTLTGVTVPAGLTLNANGTITVNANTPSGSYTVVYEICEVGASPINCKQATATVVVTNTLVANNDTPAAVSVGDSTPSVVVNDTLDGNPVVIGTNPGQVTLTGVTVPAGSTLNANGTITVNANTPSGSYTVAYEICEVGASPINCKQATATVLVTNTLVANNDTPAAVSVGDSTPSVVVNDTLDGNPVVIGTNPGQVTLTGVTVPAGLTLNANGTITVNANTPSGSYTVAYEICEVGASPINCKQATATVLVTNTLVANNDTPAAVSVGDSTPSVVVNDTLDGNPVVIGTNPGQVTLTGVTVPAGLTLNANGTITVNANTPSGSYTVAYEICEVGASPINCKQATATVVVTNTLVANNDTPAAVSVGDSTPSVVVNDTLDGNPVVIGTNPGQVTLTGVTVPAGLTLNANGTITVNANTPSGSYTVAYEICEVGASPINCKQATATVVVTNTLVANNDTPAAVSVGDSTPSVVVNDTLDGNPVVIGTNPGQVTLTGVTVPAGLTLNANGTITVNANTPSGSYTVVYEICEVGASPINCKQATATVVVTNTLVANNDTPAAVSVGDSTPSVVVNDTLDGNPVVIGTNPGQVTLTGVTVPAGLTLNANGTITVNANTPSGSYTVAYEICEVGASPINCKQATATVVVTNEL
ncbi:beta strand repeat-containing protein, partial [Flavobacterium sp. GNP001]